MTTVAEVRLWGTRVGAVSMDDGAEQAAFEYDPQFVRSRIQLSPLSMPLGPGVFRFPELSKHTFVGLPGLLADSLPDRFGNALIDAWLATQGRAAGSLTPVERLCYTGSRGMGALEFEPGLGPAPASGEELVVADLVELASQILTQREQLTGSLGDESRAESLADILRVGTSAGGARAKAVIAYHPRTQQVRSGQLQAPEGYEHWLLKFDGVQSNKDKEAADPQGYGVIEYAYHRMAVDAGVQMAPCRLLEEGGRRHFMTRRFDRTDSGDKLHMQSLGALCHFDFNTAGAHSYEQALLATRQLQLPAAQREQLFRRMVFNVVARNQDDHVKNISFVMDRRGAWSLSPAYDVMFSYQPQGQWTSRHQMSLNGKRDSFELKDIEQIGATALLKRGRAREIVAEVSEVVAQWPRYATDLGVPAPQLRAITRAHRLGIAG